MKRILSFLLVVLLLSAAPVYACTGVYVGKEVSAEATTLIGRSEDQGSGVCNKMFFVQPASSQSGREMVDTGMYQHSFSVPLPDKTYKYTYLQDSCFSTDGPYYACCTNECGLAVVGTVTTKVSTEYRWLDPLQYEGHGLREAILPALIACQASSAEDAVHVYAGLLDKYGSEEYNTLLFSDKNEAWIFENYGGHTYAAMRLPEDKVAVFGNHIMIGWVDLDETDGYYFAPGLKACLEKLRDPVVDEQGRYHLAMSIDPGKREDYSNLRDWRGHQLLAPSTAGEYSQDTFYPLLFDPDKPVSVIDVMKLFGDRLEGTEFDKRLPENAGKRAIGVTRQGCVHIIQTFDELPDCTCQLQWLAMGNAEHSIFVPAFSGITDTYDKYKIDDTESRRLNDSFYYQCKRVNALAESDREFLSQGVKDYNVKQERAMLERILEEIPTIQKKYKWFDFIGNNYVTNLGKEMAAEQYENSQKVYEYLSYIQIQNMNDYTDNGEKVHFKMPKEN